MEIPRIIVSGPWSGVGKTTVAIGLMRALSRTGIRVQGYKVGPDFIDPSYHMFASGRPSRNLDSWMLPQSAIYETICRHVSESDVAIIEGVMGLYDGSASGEKASTAELSKLLRCPVVLVVDAFSMSRSAGALVLGYMNYDPMVNIVGVVLNRVCGSKHLQWCKRAIEEVTGLHVLGALPHSEELALQERHLGLVPTYELLERVKPVTDRIGDVVAQHIEVQKVLDAARSAPPLPEPRARRFPREPKPTKAIIALAMDEAFNFYYEDNLDLLRLLGAKLLPFSPIHDRDLPNAANGIIIGGGFPEVLPELLQSNQGMRSQIKSSMDDGMPIYAECGGLMYLTRSITNRDGVSFQMVGGVPCSTLMTDRLTLGYTIAETLRASILASAGSRLRGHEFHYSTLLDVPSDATFSYRMLRGKGIVEGKDGWVYQNTLASYAHLHFLQRPKLADSFIECCATYSRK